MPDTCSVVNISQQW